MYGTRDVAVNWALEYTEALKANGFKQGKANPCLFFNPQTQVSIMVHGDDFVAVGRKEHLKETRTGLEDKYKIKVDVLGSGPGCVNEVKILNKIVRYTPEGVELEADPRHAEIVVNELGLRNAKISRVPGAKETKLKGGAKQDEIQVLDEELYQIEIDGETCEDAADANPKVAKHLLR